MHAKHQLVHPETASFDKSWFDNPISLCGEEFWLTMWNWAFRLRTALNAIAAAGVCNSLQRKRVQLRSLAKYIRGTTCANPCGGGI
jgi:hypothetical protein